MQQHEFNCPYQLGSPELVPETDTADDAVVYELDAEQGDILVLGTDGLFDNMWNDELERIVNTHLQVTELFTSAFLFSILPPPLTGRTGG